MFDYKEYLRKYNESDGFSLEYLEDRLIKYFKENIDKKTSKFTKEEYLISLFYATKELLNCNFIYEMTDVKNTFYADLYFNTRRKFEEELKDYLKNRKKINGKYVYVGKEVF